MTSLAVAALDFNTIALPQPLLHSQLLAGDSLVLLKCDATNYEQVCVHKLQQCEDDHVLHHLQDTSALLRDCCMLSRNTNAASVTYNC
jgi:hypothetical protein